MNKTFKRVLIGVGILLGLLVIVIGGFIYKFNSETEKMTPVETGQISEHGYAIKDEFVNMYLIKYSLGYIAIDAGKDINVIETEMQKLNINPDEVIAVFLLILTWTMLLEYHYSKMQNYIWQRTK